MQKVQKLARHFRTTRLSRVSSAASPSASVSENKINQWLACDENADFPYCIHQRVNYSITKDSPNVYVKVEHGRRHDKHELRLDSLDRIFSRLSSSIQITNRNLTRRLEGTPTPLVIEYSSPNIAKPLHMGHLRSTLTGKYVTRLAKFAGHEIKSLTFLGDWGTQFGVLQLGIMNKWDKNKKFQEFVKSMTLHELLNTYVESSKACEADPDGARKTALEYSALLERTFGEDNDTNVVWNHTKNLTLSHLKQCYEKLGIKFDEFEAESMYRMGCEDTCKAMDALKSSNLLESRPDGSAFIRISQDNIATVLKSDNSSVYLLRDIACGMSRSQRFPGHSHVYVVDIGQTNHFQNLFHVLKRLRNVQNTEECIPFKSYNHIPFGRVTGMSTRSGNYVLLNDVINEGAKLMHERRLQSKNARNIHDTQVSEHLAISGLIIHALRMRKTKDYAFDWDSALTSSGNSGVALQYALARMRSLNERVKSDLKLSVPEVLDVIHKSNNYEILNLLVTLLNFEDVFWRSYIGVEPCVLVAYAFTLHDRLSRAYSSVKLLDNEDKHLVASCLWVFNTSKSVLETVVKIIGMEVMDCGF